MSSLSDIRDGLVTRLLTLSGVNAGTQVQGSLADLVPFGEVGWPSVDYLAAQGGLATWTIPIRLYVGLADNQAANDSMENYLDSSGSSSVVAAVAAAPTLGGKCDDAVVTKVTASGRADVGNNTFLVIDFEVDVFA